MMNVKTVMDLTSDSAFVTGWFLDSIANGGQKGMRVSADQVAEFVAEGKKLRASKHSTDDGTQARLNVLYDLVQERNFQIVEFERLRDAAAEEYHTVTGRKWKPYSAGPPVTPRSATATNKLWDELLAA